MLDILAADVVLLLYLLQRPALALRSKLPKIKPALLDGFWLGR